MRELESAEKRMSREQEFRLLQEQQQQAAEDREFQRRMEQHREEESTRRAEEDRQREECRRWEERQLRVRQGEVEFRNHVAEFKGIQGADENFASTLNSTLDVECSLGPHVSPLVVSAAVPVYSAQASASVPETSVVLRHAWEAQGASAGDSRVVQGHSFGGGWS